MSGLDEVLQYVPALQPRRDVVLFMGCEHALGDGVGLGVGEAVAGVGTGVGCSVGDGVGDGVGVGVGADVVSRCSSISASVVALQLLSAHPRRLFAWSKWTSWARMTLAPSTAPLHSSRYTRALNFPILLGISW